MMTTMIEIGATIEIAGARSDNNEQQLLCSTICNIHHSFSTMLSSICHLSPCYHLSYGLPYTIQRSSAILYTQRSSARIQRSSARWAAIGIAGIHVMYVFFSTTHSCQLTDRCVQLRNRGSDKVHYGCTFNVHRFKKPRPKQSVNATP